MKNIILFIILIVLFSLFSYSQNTYNNILSDDVPCQLFPANNIWNTAVDKLPLESNSNAYVQTIGTAGSLHPDFGAGQWNGADIGIPYVIVPGSQPKINITFDYSGESDAGPYPIPPNPPIEGGYSSSGDRHILIVDRDNCKLYEIYSAYPNQDGTWRGGSGAVFDLNSNTLRPDSWTSADAAGFPILPGLLRYDEIAKGEINHAIRLTVPKTRNTYVWPARHKASSLTGTQYPPLGQRFRLKSTFNISSYSPVNQIILKALKKYGLLLADNGSAWFITGAPDSRWDDNDLNNLKKVKGADFEAVDCTSLIINPNSGEAKQSPSDVSSDNFNVQYLNCSPNPVHDILNIETQNTEADIQIYSIYGTKVFKSELTNKLNISFLPAGIYFLKAGDKVYKFIKI